MLMQLELSLHELSPAEHSSTSLQPLGAYASPSYPLWQWQL